MGSEDDDCEMLDVEGRGSTRVSRLELWPTMAAPALATVRTANGKNCIGGLIT